MKKILIFVLLIINFLTLSSCYGGLIPPNTEHYYDLFCNSERLSKYQQRYKKFEYGKTLKGTKIPVHEGDFIIGHISPGSYDVRAYYNFDFIEKYNLLSQEDLDKIRPTKTPDRTIFCIMFLWMDGKTKILIASVNVESYIIFDCNNDLGIFDAIEEISKKYDYDVLAEMKESSKVLLEENLTAKELYARIRCIRIVMGHDNPIMRFGHDSFKTDADIYYEYRVRDDSFNITEKLFYEKYFDTEIE